MIGAASTELEVRRDSHVTQTAAVYTDRPQSDAAGRHLGEQIQNVFGDQVPDAVIVFASSSFEYQPLLTALHRACHPKVLVGSSSAGEFTASNRGEGTACALALRSADIQVAAGLGRGISEDRGRAARDVLASFRGVDRREFAYRSALIMTDALAGHADDLVEQLTLLTSGTYQFAGGGAGDDARFARTHVFYGTEAHTDAVVALELLSSKPMGIGVGHGWTPATAAMRVTEAQGMRVTSLNGMPAVEAFEEHAGRTGQVLDRSTPLPFFLHNILGIDTGSGYRLRVPLQVNPDGSVTCAAEIPTGARVHIMKATGDSAVTAASEAARLGGPRPPRRQGRSRAVLRLRRHPPPHGGRLRLRAGVRRQHAREHRSRRVQYLRTDRAGRGAVRRLPQLHGRGDGAAGIGAMDPRTFSLAVALADSATRQGAARDLARDAGAAALLVFVEDPEMKVFLPAPDFPQTLPGGSAWRAFLAGLHRDGLHVGEVGYPTADAVVPATACVASGIAFVFVGAACDAAVVAVAGGVAPLLAAVFRAEQAAGAARGELKVAQQHAQQAETLAIALDAARAEVERTLLTLEKQTRSLDEARVRAEEAAIAKDEFLAMLGHELRNPMSPILTALQLMRLKGQDSREQDIIERQVANLMRLVDDLLDVSRITRGKIELRRERVELAEVAARAIELSSPVLEKKRQVLAVEIPARGLIARRRPLAALADPRQPADQCRQIQRRRDPRRIQRLARGGTRADPGQGPGHRHRRRHARSGLRPLRPAAAVGGSLAGRPRPGAGDRAQPGRAPRRHRARRQRRGRARQRVRRRSAARDWSPGRRDRGGQRHLQRLAAPGLARARAHRRRQRGRARSCCRRR